jgi:Animal haem peroxidase
MISSDVHMDPSLRDMIAQEACAALREVYGDDVEACDLLIGNLAEKKIPGFAISETSFHIFILMASRRLEADRFLTEHYTKEARRLCFTARCATRVHVVKRRTNAGCTTSTCLPGNVRCAAAHGGGHTKPSQAKSKRRSALMRTRGAGVHARGPRVGAEDKRPPRRYRAPLPCARERDAQAQERVRTVHGHAVRHAGVDAGRSTLSSRRHWDYAVGSQPCLRAGAGVRAVNNSVRGTRRALLLVRYDGTAPGEKHRGSMAGLHGRASRHRAG